MAETQTARPSEVLKERLDNAVRQIIESFLGTSPELYHQAIGERVSNAVENALKDTSDWLKNMNEKVEKLHVVATSGSDIATDVRKLCILQKKKLDSLSEYVQPTMDDIIRTLQNMNNTTDDSLKSLSESLTEHKTSVDGIFTLTESLKTVSDKLLNRIEDISEKVSECKVDTANALTTVSNFRPWIIALVCTGAVLIVLEVIQLIGI